MNAVQAAKNTTTKTFYDSTSRIEKAGITKDDQLYVYFEKDLTNSAESQFTLIISLGQIRTNAQVGEFGPSKSYGDLKYNTMHVPGSILQTNWAQSENSDLKIIPTGTVLTRYDTTWYNHKSFMLISNATESLYLTRTNPIEFVYVDAAIKRNFTIVTVDPIVVSKKHPAYYGLLPLTVPIDIATSPIQAILLGFAYLIYSGMGHNC